MSAADKIQQERKFLSQRVTIQKFLFDQFRETQGATGEFTGLMMEFISAVKLIAMYVNKGPKMGVFGMLGGAENATGDAQKPLDVLSNDIVEQAMGWNGSVRAMVSEELEDIKIFSSKSGKYLFATDPLDGSSNIDVNVSVGTIFSILPAPVGKDSVSAEDFLQAGTNQVAAGYVLYGPQTTLVFACKGKTVNAFTLDSDVGEFFLTSPDMRVPATTSEFAINCSRARHWEPAVTKYVNMCQAGKDGELKRNFNMRWVGSMVADVHRILHRGGIFLYPGDAELYAKGVTGKLRLLYEVNPMAFLMEHAGGRCSTGRVDCLKVVPTEIHQRLAVVLGSKEEVDRVDALHAEQDKSSAVPDAVKAIKVE